MGDESYARNSWYYAFLDALRDYTERGSKGAKKAYLNLLDPSLPHEEFRKKLMLKGEDSEN
jgi:hypothetical protein